MRRLFISFIFILFLLPGFAQNFKLGIQLSPAISTNRIESNVRDNYITDNGSKIKLRFGPIADFSITDTYYFSTGILYSPKTVNIKYGDASGIVQEQEYKLSYLQVPISLKLFTNEIALDTKIYVQMGVLAEFNITEKEKEFYDTPFITNFNFFDTSLLLGAGVDYGIGTNTVIFAGLSYNRGLINTIVDYNSIDPTYDDPTIHSDLFNVDIGVKF